MQTCAKFAQFKIFLPICECEWFFFELDGKKNTCWHLLVCNLGKHIWMLLSYLGFNQCDSLRCCECRLQQIVLCVDHLGFVSIRLTWKLLVVVMSIARADTARSLLSKAISTSELGPGLSHIFDDLEQNLPQTLELLQDWLCNTSCLHL